MNAFVVFSAIVAAASAQVVPTPYGAAVTGYGLTGLSPYTANYNLGLNTYAAPVAAAPVVAAPLAAPLAAPSSQFQAQDEFGNVNYGYANINSAKQEVGNAYGGVTGSYQYVDANGIPQRVDYIADALGFRVKASNLPVAPIHNAALPVAPIFKGIAPEPVMDTPEVQAAKAEFKAKFDEEASRTKRSVIAPIASPLAYNSYGYNSLPLAYNNLGLNGVAYNNLGLNGLAYNNLGLNGLAYSGIGVNAYAAPVAAAAPIAATVSAPAAREAVLTKIKLNPGHAVAYRVD